MRFEKKSIDSNRHRRAGERCKKAAVATANTVLARTLDGMGCIVDHRTAKRSHLHERSKIDYEIAITKECPAFGKQHVCVARGLHFFTRMFHVFWRHELSLFDL